MVNDLAKLSEHAWTWGVDKLTPEQIWKWVADYDAADPKNRTTVTRSDWEGTPVLIDHDPNPGHDRRAWLQANPAFTMKAWAGTWPKQYMDMEPEILLNSLHWYPMLEYRKSDSGKSKTIHSVWRWNPLKKHTLTGRPYKHYQTPSERNTPIKSITPHLIKLRRERTAKVLSDYIKAGIYQVKFQDVVVAYHGKFISSTKIQQVLRNDMTYLGWEYNSSSRKWEPKRYTSADD